MIKRNLKKGVNGNDVKEIVKFVRQKGGIEYAEEKKDEYANKARECLTFYSDSAIKEALFKFVDFTIMRKK